MIRRALAFVAAAAMLSLVAVGGAEETEEKKIVNGPSKTSFGTLELVLGPGASAEVAYQPDASRLLLKTLVGEARVIASARYLILVENTHGRVEILLPNGRIVTVEPGKSDIVGRAIVDDPGSIVIRLSGTGPLAQAGPPSGFVQTSAVISVLTSGPAAAILPIVNPLTGQFHGGADNPTISPRPEELSPTQ